MGKFLSLFGYKIVYVCDWGTYSTRYGGNDLHMGRHIYRKMTTAPPWAKMKIVKI
jgi:hypothetical protein